MYKGTLRTRARLGGGGDGVIFGVSVCWRCSIYTFYSNFERTSAINYTFIEESRGAETF